MTIPVLNILNNFFFSFNGSLIIPMLLFCVNLHFRKYGTVRLAGLLIPYFFIPFLYILWMDPDYLATGQTWDMIYVAPWLEVGWYNFSYVIFFIAAMGMIWFSFQTTAKHVLFYGAAAYTVQNFIYNFNRTVSYFIFGGDRTNIFVSFFGRIAVLIAFYFICVRRVRDEESLNLNNAFLILFSLIVLSVVNVLNMWLESLEFEYNPDAINIQIAFLGAMCAMLLIVVQFGFFDRSKLKNEKVVFEYLLHEAEHRQQVAKENIDLINIKCHDMKHQLAVFSGVAGTEAQQEALDQLKQTISIYDSSVNTGNEMLNVVLSEKILRCEKYGINFTWLVNGEAISFLGATDVYSLFGNALDNAIEAVGAEKEENRIIMLNVGVKGAFVNIMLENSCSVPLCFGEDGLPKTTKSDANYHGFGVKSIRYIAHKYGGTVAMQQADNKFKLSVLFPKKV